jgi:hypothetical protein
VTRREIPALVSKRGALMLAALFALAPLVLVGLYPPPESPVGLAVGLVVVGLLAAAATAVAPYRIAVWVDDVHITRRGLFGTMQVELAGAARKVEGSGTGLAQLRVDGRGGRLRTPLLALADLSARSMDPAAIDVLADALEAHGKDDVTEVLRKQAAHQRAAAPINESPLAAWTGKGVLRAAQAGGAGSFTNG